MRSWMNGNSNLSQDVFLKMYFPKCISQNVFLKMYLSKCISQNVFLKMYFSKYISQNVNLKMFCLFITMIKWLKGHKSLRVLYDSVLQQWLSVSQSVSQSVTYSVSDKGTYRAVRWQLKTYNISETPNNFKQSNIWYQIWFQPKGSSWSQFCVRCWTSLFLLLNFTFKKSEVQRVLNFTCFTVELHFKLFKKTIELHRRKCTKPEIISVDVVKCWVFKEEHWQGLYESHNAMLSILLHHLGPACLTSDFVKLHPHWQRRKKQQSKPEVKGQHALRILMIICLIQVSARAMWFYGNPDLHCFQV